MCVYSLTVPIGCVSDSVPLGGNGDFWPICLPGLQAWSHRSGPCHHHWDSSTCTCESAHESDWAHLLWSRCAEWQITHDPNLLGGDVSVCTSVYMCRLLFLHRRDYRGSICSYPPAFAHRYFFLCVFVCVCFHQALAACIHLYKPEMTPLLSQFSVNRPPPQLCLLSVYSKPDGVPGSPLTPCCPMTDGIAKPCQPSFVPLMGIWHPFRPVD